MSLPPDHSPIEQNEAFHEEVRAYLNKQPDRTAATESPSPLSGDSASKERGGLCNNGKRKLKGIRWAKGEPAPSPAPTDGTPVWRWFDGNENEHRYARLRCAANLAAFNAQPVTVSKQERARAWHQCANF